MQAKVNNQTRSLDVFLSPKIIQIKSSNFGFYLEFGNKLTGNRDP